MASLLLKDETRNPTRSLKDRATAVFNALLPAASRAPVACASAGNAAISLAAYAAATGRACHVFVPAGIRRARREVLVGFGATVHDAGGDYDDAFERAERACEKYGWFNRNCAYHPALVEGKRTVAFEIAEALDWEAPDVVIAPVGDGCTLAAIGKGFRQLQETGMVGHAPRLIGVQAAAVAPIVERFNTGLARTIADARATAATSISVAAPRNALRLLSELRASDGAVLAVEDAELVRSAGTLACEAGVVAEPASAGTVAVLPHLADRGELQGRRVVLVVTGGRADPGEEA
jgi:threonine synthase